MKVIRCASGHYYDRDVFPECPHCPGKRGSESSSSRSEKPGRSGMRVKAAKAFEQGSGDKKTADNNTSGSIVCEPTEMISPEELERLMKAYASPAAKTLLTGEEKKPVSGSSDGTEEETTDCPDETESAPPERQYGLSAAELRDNEITIAGRSGFFSAETGCDSEINAGCSVDAGLEFPGEHEGHVLWSEDVLKDEMPNSAPGEDTIPPDITIQTSGISRNESSFVEIKSVENSCKGPMCQKHQPEAPDGEMTSEADQNVCATEKADIDFIIHGSRETGSENVCPASKRQTSYEKADNGTGSESIACPVDGADNDSKSFSVIAKSSCKKANKKKKAPFFGRKSIEKKTPEELSGKTDKPAGVSGGMNGEMIDVGGDPVEVQALSEIAETPGPIDAPGKGAICPPTEWLPQDGIANRSGIRPVAGWLVGIEGPCRGRSFEIRQGRNSVGRDKINDIVIEADNRISRIKHMNIVYDPEGRGYYIEPGTGSGLVYCNDKIILAPAAVSGGEKIRIGGGCYIIQPLEGDYFSL